MAQLVDLTNPTDADTHFAGYIPDNHPDIDPPHRRPTPFTTGLLRDRDRRAADQFRSLRPPRPTFPSVSADLDD